MKRMTKRVVSLALAFMLIFGMIGVTPISLAETKETKYELLNPDVRTDLEEAEIALAFDLNVLVDSDFDPANIHDGIVADESAVKVAYVDEESEFDISKPGEYTTTYLVTPRSDKEPYLIRRHVRVDEPEGDDDDGIEYEEGGPDDPDLIGNQRSEDELPLSEGEIKSIQSSNATFTISLDKNDAGTETAQVSDEPKGEDSGILSSIGGFFSGIMDAIFPAKTAKAAGDRMKVSYSGYVSYCGHRMAYKYISEEGNYHNHLVYCLNIGKNSTDGTVTSHKNVPAKITFCLVNGARTKGGKCHTDKYSSGAADKDYFITSAAIHVLNGEVKLSYYDDGSGVFKNIKQMVEDAKKINKSDYNLETGATKRVTYTISPKSTKWKKISEDLYRSEEKFVRTKTGSIEDVTYTIKGAPAGLTVGEISKSSTDISDAEDLRRFDICVAQTDKDKPSANFYIYAKADAYDQIVAGQKTIKVTAKVSSNELYGRKWTPTVVSQQEITFLEETVLQYAGATAKVVTDRVQRGSLLVRKTSTFDNSPVEGAEYGLYEDPDCEDLMCILTYDPERKGMYASDIEELTQDTYYLKELSNPEGFVLDDTVHEIDISYFTLYDANDHVTQEGQEFTHYEQEEPVSVMVIKKDGDTAGTIKNASFAIFDDEACTVRTKIDETSGPVPEFTYDEDLDGYVSERFFKTQDTYYVKEVGVPTGYVDAGAVFPVQPERGELVTIDVANTAIKCEINAEKLDKETGQTPQGDAVLSGALYGLYAETDISLPDGSGCMKGTDITCTAGTDFTPYDVEARAGTLLATVKTDEQHKFGFKDLYFGDYYIQEIEPSVGYLLNDTRYPVKFTTQGNTSQTIKIDTQVDDTVKKQAFEMIKVSTNGESTETKQVEGAEFTVKLKSEIAKGSWESAKAYDTLTTDAKGFAKSIELPYGEYLVRETKVPKDLEKAKDFTVSVTEDSRDPQVWRIFNDAPFQAYIRLIKKDIETGEVVRLSGVTFKIRKVGEESYIEQKVGDKKISEFITDETGMITTPLKLLYGEYEAVEIKAPEGYLINSVSKPFTVTRDGAIQVREDDDGDAVIDVEVTNQPVKGRVLIHKSGETLKGAAYDTIFDRILTGITGDNRNVTFTYESTPLDGAVFDLIADEDIYTADHAVDEKGNRKIAIYEGKTLKKGEVAATVTTAPGGAASIDNLPLGKYHLVETKAPRGFIPMDKTYPIDLVYADDHTAVVEAEAKVENIRQKIEVSVVKTEAAVVTGSALTVETVSGSAVSPGSVSVNVQPVSGSSVTLNESTVGTPVEGATYGIYATQDIKDKAGNVLVAAGTLIESEKTDANGRIIFTADLPLGKYYVKEIESAPGYLLDEGEYEVDFTNPDPATEITKKEIRLADLPIIIQVSKQDITTSSEIPDATLQILDNNDEVFAEWTSDGSPYTVVAIPPGDYTLVETAAPYGYMITTKAKFTVTATKEIQHVTMVDERVPGILEIMKTDRETGDPLEGVKFEVYDESGQVVDTLTTDEDGIARSKELPIGSYLENGVFDKPFTYTVKETKTNAGYLLSDATHEVRFEYEDQVSEPIVEHLNITNQPTVPKLPQTGGSATVWIYVIAILIGGVIGVYLYFRKKNGGK